MMVTRNLVVQLVGQAITNTMALTMVMLEIENRFTNVEKNFFAANLAQNIISSLKVLCKYLLNFLDSLSHSIKRVFNNLILFEIKLPVSYLY